MDKVCPRTRVAITSNNPTASSRIVRFLTKTRLNANVIISEALLKAFSGIGLWDCLNPHFVPKPLHETIARSALARGVGRDVFRDVRSELASHQDRLQP